MTQPDRIARWLAALEERHLEVLSFAEVRRALQALSSLYVERRGRVPFERAFDGAGKQAAFALFYGPLHFFVIREVVRALKAEQPPPEVILDLGCGTGTAGAAWALGCRSTPPLLCVDRHPWAVEEARWTLRCLGLRGRVWRGEMERTPMRGPRGAVIAGFAVNEMASDSRGVLLESLLAGLRRGQRTLIVEPVSRRVAPWWEEWSAAFVASGGSDLVLRFAPELPELLRRLDRAAGLDHGEIAVRVLAANLERKQHL